MIVNEKIASSETFHLQRIENIRTPQSAGFLQGLEAGGSSGRNWVSASASGPAVCPALSTFALGADHLVSSHEMVLFCLKEESKIEIPSPQFE